MNIRKERFKLAKNAAYYEAPKKLSVEMGILRVTEAGVFETREGYSVAYRLIAERASVIGEKREEFIRVLRGYDIKFSLWEWMEEACVLLVLVLDRSAEVELVGAEHRFAMVEKDMEEQLSQLGLLLDRLSAEERLHRLHRQVLAGTEHRIDTNHYMKGNGAWLKDITMRHRTEEKQLLRAENGCFGTYFLRTVTTTYRGSVLRIIREIPGIRCISQAFIPVSDIAVKMHTEQLFYEAKRSIEALRRSDKEMYRLLQAKSNVDERNFLLTGITFMVGGSDGEMLRQNIDAARARFPDTKAEIVPYFYRQKDCFQRFARMDTFEQERLVWCKTVANGLPFGNEEKDGNAEELARLFFDDQRGE